MPTGDHGRRPPAHAGRLRPWERFTITLVFSVMAAVVIAIMVYGGRTRHPAGPQVPARPGSPNAARPAVQRTGTGAGRPGGIRPASEARENQLLAVALAPVLRHRSGNLAVGVIDSRTEATAVYHGTRHFHAASIVKADILAALLLQQQRAGTPLSVPLREAAADMIDRNNEYAADVLWDAIGDSDGLRDANRLLHLSHTTPGTGIYWGLTSTTVGDQLRLLAALTSSSSLLWPSSRSYELGLMRHVPADQAWGVAAAATPGSSPAVKNGWLAGGSDAGWVVNSMGVISRAGHTVLVVVLSDNQPTESAGISQDEAAARAAVSAIIRG